MSYKSFIIIAESNITNKEILYEKDLISLTRDSNNNITEKNRSENLVDIRYSGSNLEGKSIYLSPFYNWHIGYDDMKSLVLVPIPKSYV
jgi:hypothetical protein